MSISSSIPNMSASTNRSASLVSRQRAEVHSPLGFNLGPSAPRGARRCAPFVVIGGLVLYAVIVISALTSPASADDGESGDLKLGSARSEALIKVASENVTG